MRRRGILRVLGAGALASLAGCAGSSTESPSGTTTTPTETSTQDPEKSTNESSTSVDELSHPPGLSADGITDVEQLVKNHEAFLRNIPNYTEEVVLHTIEPSGETGENPTKITVRSDSATNQLLVKYQDHHWDIRVFYDGTFYEYNAAGDTVAEGSSPSGLFSDTDHELEPLAFYFVALLMPPILRAFTISPKETTTIDGKTANLYTVTGVSEEKKAEQEGVTYQGADGQLVTTSKGGILDLKYVPRFESESTSLQTASYEVREMGETSVSRPEWLN